MTIIFQRVSGIPTLGVAGKGWVMAVGLHHTAAMVQDSDHPGTTIYTLVGLLRTRKEMSFALYPFLFTYCLRDAVVSDV